MLDDGNDEARFGVDRDPQMPVPVVDDVLPLDRRVDLRELLQRGDRGLRDERHVGELDVVALEEAVLEPLTELDDRAHVDLVDRRHVGRGVLRLDHAAGDRLADRGHRDALDRLVGSVLAGGSRRGGGRRRTGWSRSGSGGCRRRSGRLEPREHVVARDAAEGLHGAFRRPAIRVAGEHQARERAAGDRAGILLRAPDGGLRLRDPPLDLRLGEGRRQQHLGHQVQPEPEVALEHAERHVHAVAARARLEAAADELDRGVQLGPAAPGRAAREEPAREPGEARPVGRIEHAARSRVGADGDDGDCGPLGHQEDDAVRQHFPVRDGRGRASRRGQQHQEDDHDGEVDDARAARSP